MSAFRQCQYWRTRTGNAEVTGSNHVEALIFFFRLLLSNCLNWKIYCDDHSSLSSTTAVQIWIISYTSHHWRIRLPRNRAQVFSSPRATYRCVTVNMKGLGQPKVFPRGDLWGKGLCKRTHYMCAIPVTLEMMIESYFGLQMRYRKLYQTVQHFIQSQKVDSSRTANKKWVQL